MGSLRQGPSFTVSGPPAFLIREVCSQPASYPAVPIELEAIMALEKSLLGNPNYQLLILEKTSSQGKYNCQQINKNFFNRSIRGAVGMAQQIKSLSYKHEDPSLILSTYVKSWAQQHIAVILAVGSHRQADAGISLASLFCQIGEFQGSVKDCLKN